MFIGASLSGISAHRVRIQSHILNNAEDVNLATWLATQSPDVNKIQQVTIPSGQTIGGTSTGNYALTTGNLASYTKGVELIILGNIEGKGGAASSGAGSHGLEATSDIHIVDTSNIYGGGGGGGNGGLGGYGMTTTNQLYGALTPPGISCLANHTYMWIYGPSNPPECGSWWGGSMVFNATTLIYTKQVGDKWYWPGSDGSPGQYHIYRGTHASGIKGAGGAGGRGQGYNQTLQSGSGGDSGVNRAGDGGTGGTGSAFDTAGIGGGQGGGGLYYGSGTQGRNTPSTGDAGIAGGAKGNNVVENGGSIINTHLY